MDSELENKVQGSSAEQNQSNRESYQPEGYYQREHRNGVRSQRPRIHTPRAYNLDRNNDRENSGFRPEGFGGVLQSGSEEVQSRQYRPRFNNNSGGYQSRQGDYGQPRQGGYRPRYYNNNGDNGGGYQPYQGGYGQSRQYRPRYNNNNAESSYQPRQVGCQHREGGYQPRGGYNNRGGYNRSGFNNNCGYNNNRGGYNEDNGYRQRTTVYDPHANYSMKKLNQYNEERIDNYDPLQPCTTLA